jgi:hypothetical protein
MRAANGTVSGRQELRDGMAIAPENNGAGNAANG